MARLVHYSLVLPDDDPRPDLVWQLGVSLQTLRAHNRDMPVVLFLYGPMTGELYEICRAHGVMVHLQGPYQQRLAALCPTGAPALARYPLLHKYLNFRELAETGATQVLCCDCDTVFLGDVARIFDRYGHADLVAREEVHSRRSHYGADRTFVDETLLSRLAGADEAATIPPFNAGVILLNHGVVRRLVGLDALFVDYAWRFLLWMAQHPVAGAAAAYGELDAAHEARGPAYAGELGRALPYPSVNRWILDEVALWLALGHVEGLRTADFDRRDVAQNGEFGGSDPARAGWTVCHYYSQNAGRIAAWLRGEAESTAA